MATEKQKRAAKAVAENGGNISKAMRDVGYSPQTAKTPQKLTGSDGWKELMGKHLSDEKLAEKHDALLNSTRLDHMTFPLGPADESDYQPDELDQIAADAETSEFPASLGQERTTLTDADITQMLADVNCVVRRIVHGRSARHVYFWSADNRARKEALDMAYKLKGRYAATKVSLVDPYGELEDDDLEAEIARRHSDSGASKKSAH